MVNFILQAAAGPLGDADLEETFLGYLQAKAADGHLALFTREELEYVALRVRDIEREQNGE